MFCSPILKATFRPSFRNVTKFKKIAYGAGFLTLGSAIAVYRAVDSPEDLYQVGIIRFGRAFLTVSKIVYDYKTNLGGLLDPSEEYDATIKGCHQRSALHLLDLAKQNGGVFIKVGQHIAAMEYLVPPEYTQTLSVLMSKAPQASLADVHFVVEEELGGKVNEVFADFEETPVGAASLAQVHIARLKGTGEKVAVKVQHRRVLKNSKTDINTMEFLVNVADRLFPEFRLMWLVDEVKKNLPNELDFIHEAKNADIVREKFKHLSFLKVPKIFYEYSTPRVLTMEYCEGAHIDDVQFMDDNKINKHDICRKLGRLISEMIFLSGCLHSDPHPGNVLVNKKKSGQVEIVLLDHGLYLNLDDRFRGLYSDLWMALLNADQERMRSVANEMGVGDLYGLFACIVSRRSWKSVTEGIRKTKMDNNEKHELRQYAASLIPQISEVLSRMPREMLLILKTNDLLRNIEHILMTSCRGDSMIEMSKCVIRSHYGNAIAHSKTRFTTLKLNLLLVWSLFKISTLEWYLIIRDSLGMPMA